MRFEIMTAVRMWIVVLWVVKPYSLVCGYQHFTSNFTSALKTEVICSSEILVTTYRLDGITTQKITFHMNSLIA